MQILIIIPITLFIIAFITISIFSVRTMIRNLHKLKNHLIIDLNENKKVNDNFEIQQTKKETSAIKPLQCPCCGAKVDKNADSCKYCGSKFNK